jgi:DNA-binding transcriptional ArsR family regulator
MFKTQSSSHIRRVDRAMVIYPAYGLGTLQVETKPKAGEESLSLLLGERKTAILCALIQPQSTQELAHKLHLSAGGISQHLQRLHEAGLVETYRNGYYVFYRLSTRGEKLRELFND